MSDPSSSSSSSSGGQDNLENKLSIPKNFQEAEDEREKRGRIASDCMLGQMFFTAGGVGIGLALKLQRKSIVPFLIATSIGTTADLTYGYVNACKDVVQDYKAANKLYRAFKESEEALKKK